MVKILHALPGRLRLRFQAVKGRPEFAARVESHLTAVSGIHRVTVNTLTGSVLLRYDPTALRSPLFLDALSTALGNLFPGQFAPGRLRVTVERLKGRDALARRIEEHLTSVWGIDQVEIDPSTGDCLLVYDSQAVASPEFIDAMVQPLATLVPWVNWKKALARLGL